jgi:hypothetical protein
MEVKVRVKVERAVPGALVFLVGRGLRSAHFQGFVVAAVVRPRNFSVKC